MSDVGFQKWMLSGERSAYYNIDYYLTPKSFNEDYFLKEVLPKIYRQVVFSRRYRKPFLLKSDRNFFSDKRWLDVLWLIERFMWSNSTSPEEKYNNEVLSETMVDYLKRVSYMPIKYAPFAIEKAREIFRFTQEHSYPLFKDFYELNINKIGEHL